MKGNERRLQELPYITQVSFFYLPSNDDVVVWVNKISFIYIHSNVYSSY
jgi:hypothetical protein